MRWFTKHSIHLLLLQLPTSQCVCPLLLLLVALFSALIVQRSPVAVDVWGCSPDIT